MHGYQLIEDMENNEYVKSGRFKTGSIYTILNRMEHKGLLISNQEISEEGRPRRVYSITSRGKEILKRGLEGITIKKELIDDLTKFYYEKFY
jgi:DNA-binding PadR family transcriptional regulator